MDPTQHDAPVREAPSESDQRFLANRTTVMSLYEFGPFQLDAERLLLLRNGEPVAVGPKVVETLLALIEHCGELLAKNELLDRIWPEGYVEEANLAQNIYVLRKVLRDWRSDAIETIPRRGYRFTAPVQRVERQPVAPVVAVAPEPEVVTVPDRRPTSLLRNRFVVAVAAAAFAMAAFVGVVVTLAIADRAHPAQQSLSDSGSRLYAIGHYYWNLRTRNGVEKSLIYFKQVVDSDPHVALGYAALAEGNAAMGDYHYGTLPPNVYFERARAYAEKALALDPNSAEGHAALGFIAINRGQFGAALNELQRSLQLDQQYGPAHEWYGIALLHEGQLPDAFRQLRAAADLDPLSVATTAWLGSAAYLDRRFSDAIAYSRQTLDLSPQRADAYATLGLSYEAQGDYDRAIDTFKRFSRTEMGCRAQGAAYLAYAYANAHRMREARAELAYAMAHSKDVAPEDLAAALAAVGHRTVALGVLRHARNEMSWMAIANDPRFDRLRTDAQFRQLTQGPD